ncbi:endolysin [Enterococcus faecalis AZ19]|uniref:GH25 family lysozyme n=1 Tax=Enterococcus faecalis TaxID=1351 RepID=UPI000459BB97|nr:GH25 family lysozyme [Enterococcus faecalis]KAJ76053.1 endolysin [Enterococcus faecalis AZ19]
MTLNGIDISGWQAGINVGAQGVPADCVIIKATGGTGYVNPDCDRAFQEAISSGKKVAIYHFANEVGFEGTPEQEAAFFLENINGYIGKAILILDWESTNKGDVQWAKRWLDTVKEQTGVSPLFYTYTGILQSYDFSIIANADYGLWLADYGMNSPQGYSQPTPPSVPYWEFITMYQYTSNGQLPGWDGRLDLNIFYGDREAWDKYAHAKGHSSVVSDSPVPPATKRRYGYRVDDVQLVNGIFQVKNDVLGQPNFDWTDNGINVAYIDKIDPATGENAKDQELQVGDYFAFQTASVGVITEQVNTAGKTLSHVQFPDGFIWLYTPSVEKLIYG